MDLIKCPYCGFKVGVLEECSSYPLHGERTRACVYCSDKIEQGWCPQKLQEQYNRRLLAKDQGDD